jgi:uncharacterized protein (DUF486 family)
VSERAVFQLGKRRPADLNGRWKADKAAGMKASMPTILLLLASNVFMTLAWYWHLRGGMEKPILLVILISWGIALIEYCFAVPANRIGYAGGWSAGQLKIAQEAIALLVFGAFMVSVLGEPLHWRHLAAFACIMCGVGFMFVGR